MVVCKNCKNEFEGNYCNSCGEKVVDARDFTMRRILGDAIGSITNVDSKLYKSLAALFFRPGKLSTAFVDGLRVPYMKPFQIFVISNILFFIFLSDIDLFRTPSQWFFRDDFDGIPVLAQVMSLTETNGWGIEEIAYRYDTRSSNLAKGLIVVLIPFMALIGKLLHPSNKMAFGKHVVFATHYFALLLFLCVIISQIIYLFPLSFNKWLFIVPVTFLMYTYYVLGIKEFYTNSWLISLIKGIIGIVLVTTVVQMYKMAINLIALYSL